VTRLATRLESRDGVEAGSRSSALDLARIVAAMAVVLYHYGFFFTAPHVGEGVRPYPTLSFLARYGHLGVQLFFMISGYLIVQSAGRKSLAGFARARARRLYPAYLVCCIVTYVVYRWIEASPGALAPLTFGDLAYNLTMFNGVLDGVRGRTPRYVDGSYWTLAVEWLFYMLVAALIVTRLLARIEWALWAWMATTVAAWTGALPLFTFLTLTPWSAYFIAGAAFFRIHSEGCTANRVALVGVAFVLAAAQAAAQNDMLAADFGTPFHLALTLGFVVAFFAFFAWLPRIDRIGFGSATRAIALLGALSYPIYLLHFHLGAIAFRALWGHIAPFDVLTVLLVGVLALSYAVHRWVERPVWRRLRAMAASRRDEASAIPTLGTLDRGHDNNLNLLRFVAASMVVVSHSYPLSGHRNDEPLARALGFIDLGSLAVAMFFAISGYLIAKSFARTPSVLAFLRARFLRIVPAYLAAVLLAALVIGPVATSLPAAEYLRSEGLWRYVAETSTIFGGSDRLPGVFGDNPYPFAINGSLWTLSLEVACYLGLMVAGLAGALTRRWIALAVALGLFALAETWPAFVAALPRSEAIVTPRLAGTFVAGSLAYAWRQYVPVHPALAVAAVVGAMLSVSTSFAAYAVYGAIAYASLVIAYAPSLDVPAFRRLGDYSYGIYVFAFPTQQAIAWVLGPIPPPLLFGLAYPVIFALAFASWHLIEAPALALKGKRR